MKAVVTDYTFPDLATESAILASAGAEVVGGQCHTAESLIPLVRDADAVITQFAPVDATVIDAMQRARVIVRYGIGVDNVDLDAARARRIPVCNVPDYCIDEVADHTLAFILATTRQVMSNCLHTRNGHWGLATPIDQMRTLRDLTVGVVGFGRIGREVAARLLPFKCRVLVFDPGVPADRIQQAGGRAASLAELLAESDVVTLHCPCNEQTRRIINRDALAAMKPGATLINLGRGDLVDSQALTSALEQGRLAAAALDVFAPEPIPAGHPILKMDNVLLAPHLASMSVSSMRALRETAAQIAALALRGEPLPNVVNGVAASV